MDQQARQLHLTAVAALHRVGGVPWYDSRFLRMFEAAKLFLASVRPEALDRFVAAFDPLRTRASFKVAELSEVFSPDVFHRLRECVAQLDRDSLETHERDSFGRLVLHDDPWFTQLQADMTARVAALAGEALVSSYNFLSLYADDGRCEPHMDEPEAKWTLDICIDQSAEWPIFVSQPVAWPDHAAMRGFSAEGVQNDPALHFQPKVLRPNDAILFAGSSQWHYRQPIAPGNHCNLLFFHYRPAGCEELIRPKLWAEHFALPELEVLAELGAMR